MEGRERHRTPCARAGRGTDSWREKNAVKIAQFVLALIGACCLIGPAAALADDSSASDSAPAPYAKFIDGAQVQNGLFNVIRKDGKVYLEIAPAQLDQDYIQTGELVNGLGGYGILPGGISSSALII